MDNDFKYRDFVDLLLRGLLSITKKIESNQKFYGGYYGYFSCINSSDRLGGRSSDC